MQKLAIRDTPAFGGDKMAELQEKYQIKYKGRKGRKRLQEIEGALNQIRQGMGNVYDDCEEMRLLETCMPDPELLLYFMRYLGELDAFWHGAETYGLLRLCAAWVREHEAAELSQPDVDDMLESLLPSAEWGRLVRPAQEGAQ